MEFIKRAGKRGFWAHQLFLASDRGGGGGAGYCSL